MHIKIIALGSIKELHLQNGIKEYIKRLGPYSKLEIIEIPEKKISGNDSGQRIKLAEAALIKSRIKKDEYIISLDEVGEQLSSCGFADLLEKISRDGKITFIIGGPLGLDEKIRADSNKVISLSKMTFTHQMARFFLMEQIYRAFTIIHKKTYHY